MNLKPAVFIVGDMYQILVPVQRKTLMWVQVGDKFYYDDSNGTLRSMTKMHRMHVPAEVLDEAKEYTICYRLIPHRKPYGSTPSDVMKQRFAFTPIPEKNVRAYHIADGHNMTEEPIRAAKTYGDFDFLIFNGDMPNHSGDVKNFFGIFEIAYALTGGSKPIVFAKGNHDLRGIYAEKYVEYTPNAQGNSYYTFRLGNIWGVVLDCGEDKNDDHVEYGHTICCHDFRLRETAFLQKVAADKEYEDSSIKLRLVISHNPFTHQLEEPFNIEKETYTQWAQILRDEIKPNLMISGHLHDLFVSECGSPYDHLGQPCTVLVGSDKKKNYWAGVGIAFDEKEMRFTFTDSDGKILREETANY